MANGYITIGTELNTDKFDKQISDLERKMKKEEDKKIEIETKMDANIKELEDARKEVDKLAESYQKMKNIQDKLQAGKGKPIDFSTFSEMESQFGSLEKLGTTFDKALSKQDQLELKANQMKKKYEEINQNVSDYATKIASVKFNKQQAEIEQVKKGFDRVGSSIQSAVRQAGRMVLSIIGIRTGLAMLRKASSELTTYDTQYATNLEYIRFALTQMIAPILRYIVGLVATILQYINAILSAWFGVNLFANSSAKAFQKMKAGAGGVAKAAKEIKKELAGFDEINMLTDTGEKETGGIGGGIVSPDFDLGQDIKIPEWLQWIIDNGDLILSILAGIATALGAIKLGISVITALGIGTAVAGIVYTIQALLDYLKEPTWENFGKIIQGIGIFVTGLGVAFLGLPAIVVGVTTLIVGTIVKHWDKIREKLQSGINWLKGKTDWVKEHFGVVGEFIYNYFVNKLQQLLLKFDWLFTTMKKIFDKIIEFLKLAFAGKWDEIFERIKNKAIDIFEKIKTTVIEKFEGIKNKIVEIYGKIKTTTFEVFEGIKTTISEVFKTVIDTVIEKFETLKEGIKTKIDAIKTFFSNLINDIKDKFYNFGSAAGESIGEAFKSVVNRVLDRIESILNTPIESINSMISSLNNLPGVNIRGRLSSISLPRLAVGGIVNMPNKGALVGGAITGESGREGVLPLTDSQAMSELGYEIGKNVVVNLTNITEMNGRIIGRELKRVQSQQDFAYNS